MYSLDNFSPHLDNKLTFNQNQLTNENLNISKMEYNDILAKWIIFDKKSNSLNINSLKKKTKTPDMPSKRWGHSSLIVNENMLVFGGRNSTRNLANIFAFNLENLFWYKIEPLGQIPPARDSHSTLLVYYIFYKFSSR